MGRRCAPTPLDTLAQVGYVMRTTNHNARRIMRMTVPNTNKVPKKQWTKWNKKEVRLMFNGLYKEMMDEPQNFQHHKAVQLEGTYWKTVAWNASWIAADILNDNLYPED